MAAGSIPYLQPVSYKPSAPAYKPSVISSPAYHAPERAYTQQQQQQAAAAPQIIYLVNPALIPIMAAQQNAGNADYLRRRGYGNILTGGQGIVDDELVTGRRKLFRAGG